ncbi:alpha/beta fold hydrolase [Nocardiopsis sp. NPDC007018]|uniref:alpha/beta hydrolase n=1 Tax=Nocardiopsis sp. NPDC007018 TaxID=3155721 RepID=UPI0033E3CC22
MPSSVPIPDPRASDPPQGPAPGRTGRRRLTAVACAVAALGLLTASVTALTGRAEADPGADAGGPPMTGPEWRECTVDDLLPPPPEGVEAPPLEIPQDLWCAGIEVPVDHGDPAGRSTSLQVGTLPHTGDGASRGTVLYVAGGPGAGGVQDLAFERETLTDLRADFDVVAWNPRGTVGATAGLLPHEVCGDLGPVYRDVGSEEEFDERMDEYRAVMDQCRDRDPVMFASMDTSQHVGDMEALRVALGEERLSLYAQSYGGVRATAYAERYPERLRAVFMDSTVDHVSDPAVIEERLLLGQEELFAGFGRWCADDPGCALHGEDVQERWSTLLDTAAEEPLHAGRARFGRAELSLAGAALLRSEAVWPRLAETVARTLERGDATPFLEVLGGPMFEPNTVVADICGDWAPFDDFAGYREATDRAVAVSENFGHGRSLHHLPCAAWPEEGVNPPGPIDADGVPPFLVAASELEYPYTAPVADHVPGSVVVTVEGRGHGLYFFETNTCVVGHANRYFVDGALPAPGTRCALD